MKRQIIRIDEEKCTGCGDCVSNCAEGSLEIINGKAVLVKEALCDGLGACLGHCPEDALIIEERDADAFDEDLVEVRLQELGRPSLKEHAAPSPAPASDCGCPSAQMMGIGGGCPSAQASSKPASAAASDAPGEAGVSELTHWPVQLGLLPPTAPFFEDADLVLTADCVPFAYPDFHRDFLKGRAVAVACPKLDNAEAHYAKLVETFRSGGLRSLTVVRMEVPCCGGLVGLAAQALEDAGSNLAMREVIIGRDGTIASDQTREAKQTA